MPYSNVILQIISSESLPKKSTFRIESKLHANNFRISIRINPEEFILIKELEIKVDLTISRRRGGD